MVFAVWAFTPVQAQTFSVNVIHSTVARVNKMAAIEGRDGKWLILATDHSVHWSRDGGEGWVVENFQGELARDVHAVGDSMFVVATQFAGLLGLEARDPSLVHLGPGQSWDMSFTVGDDGSWLSGGHYGVARSLDEGRTWSAIDTLFVDSCCTETALIRNLSEGLLIAWAQTGSSEFTNERLFYSPENGLSWDDSTGILGNWQSLNEVLSTPNHVELQVGTNLHRVRRSWNVPLTEFSSSFTVTDAAYSPLWGVVVSSDHGVYQLDESSFEWAPVWTGGFTDAIAATPDGRLYFSSDHLVFELRPNSTGSELPGDRSYRLSVYPNPAVGIIHIQGLRPATPYSVYDVLGRRVSGFESVSGWHSVSIDQFTPGIYLIVSDIISNAVSDQPTRFVITN